MRKAVKFTAALSETSVPHTVFDQITGLATALFSDNVHKNEDVLRVAPADGAGLIQSIDVVDVDVEVESLVRLSQMSTSITSSSIVITSLSVGVHIHMHACSHTHMPSSLWMGYYAQRSNYFEVLFN